MKRLSSLFLSLTISLVLAFGGAAQDNKDKNRGRDQKPEKKPEVIQVKPKEDRGKKDQDKGDRKKNN
jgi:hypothetical protein